MDHHGFGCDETKCWVCEGVEYHPGWNGRGVYLYCQQAALGFYTCGVITGNWPVELCVIRSSYVKLSSFPAWEA